MKVRDVMTRNVISIGVDQTILEAARMMLQNNISGLPVADETGKLVGMVTEGDFLRRSEIGTQRRRPKWLEFLLGPGWMAEDYVRASGRKVDEIMTRDPATVTEDDTLETVVELMERERVKRLPVLRDGRMVGLISRANLMRAVVSLARNVGVATGEDSEIRERVLAAFAQQSWAPRIDVVVKDGVAELWGTIIDERERQACRVLAENAAGVREIRDHLVWLEPFSRTVFSAV